MVAVDEGGADVADAERCSVVEGALPCDKLRASTSSMDLYGCACVQCVCGVYVVCACVCGCACVCVWLCVCLRYGLC